MPIRGRLSWLAVTLAIWTIAAGGTPAAEPKPSVDGTRAQAIAAAQALAREGRFEEAYQRLAADGAKADPAALAALARVLLVRAIGSDDVFERWAGMRAARGIADPAFVDPARAQLHSGSRYEEALALEILANSDPDGNHNEFVAALDSPFRTVRVRALRALAHRADPTLVPRLMVLVGEDNDPDLRVLAIRILREWKATNAAPTLRHAVDDPIPAVQQEAVKALVVIGDDEVLEIVRRRVTDAPTEQRAAALRLATLVPRRELLVDVAPFLGDPDPDIRAAAAGAVLVLRRAGEGG